MSQQALIQNVVQEVLKQLGAGKVVVTPSSGGGRPGVFGEVNPAVETAQRSQRQLAAGGLAVRDGIVKLIKSIAKANADERKSLAHTIKGTARSVGAFPIADVAERIEKAPLNSGLINDLGDEIAHVLDFVAALTR